MKKDKHIGIALETETYNKLSAYAIEDHRKVGNLVRHIIKLYIRGIESGNILLSVYDRTEKWNEVKSKKCRG